MRRAKQVDTPKNYSESRNALLEELREKVIGQSDSLESIVAAVQIQRAGLAPEGRPAGIFMLLGPTGTGKTHTVEALAEVIHGSTKNVLRIDCGEYQMEHEVAKLIGAPPGYLGHRETQPVLTQMKLNAVMSEKANIAIILFDEIEKAAASMLRILLGILDKGTLRLGDNSVVQFERTLIFLTSNLGAKEISRELNGPLGFCEKPLNDEKKDLSRITLSAVRRKLTPEFINRIDSFLTYNPLTPADVRKILDIQLENLTRFIGARQGSQYFAINVSPGAKEALLKHGYSEEYGARNLKRTLHTQLLNPIADLIMDRSVEAGSIVSVGAEDGKLTFRIAEESLLVKAARSASLDIA